MIKQETKQLIKKTVEVLTAMDKMKYEDELELIKAVIFAEISETSRFDIAPLVSDHAKYLVKLHLQTTDYDAVYSACLMRAELDFLITEDDIQREMVEEY